MFVLFVLINGIIWVWGWEALKFISCLMKMRVWFSGKWAIELLRQVNEAFLMNLKIRNCDFS